MRHQLAFAPNIAIFSSAAAWGSRSSDPKPPFPGAIVEVKLAVRPIVAPTLVVLEFERVLLKLGKWDTMAQYVDDYSNSAV